MQCRAQLQTMPVMNSGFNGRLPCFYLFQCMWLWLIFCLVTSMAFINIAQVPPGTVWWRDHFPVVFGNFWSQKSFTSSALGCTAFSASLWASFRQLLVSLSAAWSLGFCPRSRLLLSQGASRTCSIPRAASG